MRLSMIGVQSIVNEFVLQPWTKYIYYGIILDVFTSHLKLSPAVKWHIQVLSCIARITETYNVGS